jgi:hypothetical protein
MFDNKTYMKQWRLDNKERLSQYSKDYAAKNKKRIKDYMKEYVRPEESRLKKNKKQKEYALTNPDKAKSQQRNATLKKKYKITLDQFNALLLKQNNSCPICLRFFIDKVAPCVDHCHVTNNVRGILCRQCNAAIGQLGDNEECLQRAVDYLKRQKDV